MNTMLLRVITPKKVVKEEEVTSVTLPGADGEFTVLPRHMRLFALLVQGIITIRSKGHEESLGIGGGYVETDGKELNVLVSAAYGQNEIDEKLTQEALSKAQKILKESKDDKERHDATMLLRRSIVDLKLLKRKRPPRMAS